MMWADVGLQLLHDAVYSMIGAVICDRMLGIIRVSSTMSEENVQLCTARVILVVPSYCTDLWYCSHRTPSSTPNNVDIPHK